MFFTARIVLSLIASVQKEIPSLVQVREIWLSPVVPSTLHY
ncbi:hypothetical protein PDIG_34770 [Penicillium digitatum PHI26]|uniref:Uncharacterized protein n=2 Tax=Penicillium digitatum TaxID=36651 RepID=K9FY23_PEND2|nr:hypothetical protein PDIP_54340 [Penicillium digitatum Pd1]EKV11952.1 hypothetical protein PDIP_54340 [Penicillium digitatum Pd1]EKV13994.1 hypothetical protein PDIG_34770 [Penicillium digitatum PHI26]